MKHEDQFKLYFEMLVETNKSLNLTAITGEKEVYIKHFEDSLSLARAIPDLGEKDYRIIDVGTGAGFPGLPLAIAYPNIRITLTDALQKRLTFINNVVDKLDLKNVKTVHGRAEDLGQNPEYRAVYDFAVARAVSNLSTLCEYCTPFIHNCGQFIAYKSGNTSEELDAAKRAFKELNLELKDIREYSLSENMGERTLLIIEKTKDTPGKYPRKAGIPGKKPL